MNIMFGEEIGKRCLVYIDDILVYGKTKEQHNENLRVIEEIIKNYGLKENRDKRVQCVEAVKFLGYEIELNKLKPSLDRSQGIVDFETPKNKRGLQRFLGMINFDRIFIKDINKELYSLYDLLRQENKFNWT
jgi:hypothetical protein